MKITAMLLCLLPFINTGYKLYQRPFLATTTSNHTSLRKHGKEKSHGKNNMTQRYGKSFELTILSWNIERGEQLTAIARLLRSLKSDRLSPDIVALQEVDVNCKRTRFANQVAVLAGHSILNLRHTAFGLEFVEKRQNGHSMSNNARHGQAILSRHPFVSEPVTKEFKKQKRFLGVRVWRLMGRHGGRSFTKALIRLPDGKRLLFYNTHLESMGSDMLRKRQLDELAGDIVESNADNIPIIIAGDFNNAKTYKISPVFKNLEKLGFRNPLYEKYQDTKAQQHKTQIDFIFVRGATMILYQYSRVIQTSASDHNAVMVRIRL